MKRIFVAISTFLISAITIIAQTGNLNQKYLDSNIPTNPDLSSLEPIDYLEPRPDDVMWSKVLWRQIDLREKLNQPLYFPITPSDGRISLFNYIFKLLEENKISAYKYDEKSENFIPENKVSFSNLLKTMDTYYEVIRDSVSGDSIGIRINDVDVKSNEVYKFYLKEVWYFDQIESALKVKILAICPQWYHKDPQSQEILKTPLFWVPFESLRTHLAKQAIIVNDYNNSARMTLDDFFMKRRFNSYIYKENNIYNRSIIEYASTSDEVHAEQDRIKNEIVNFEQDLWDF